MPNGVRHALPQRQSDFVTDELPPRGMRNYERLLPGAAIADALSSTPPAIRRARKQTVSERSGPTQLQSFATLVLAYGIGLQDHFTIRLYVVFVDHPLGYVVAIITASDPAYPGLDW